MSIWASTRSRGGPIYRSRPCPDWSRTWTKRVSSSVGPEGRAGVADVRWESAPLAGVPCARWRYRSWPICASDASDDPPCRVGRHRGGLRGDTAPRGCPSSAVEGGRPAPAHATGVGKALLAASDPDVIERAIAAGLVAVGPRTIRNPEVLRQQLRRAAVNGIAYEHEEAAPGSCVSQAPCLTPKTFLSPRFRRRDGQGRSISDGWGQPSTPLP